MKNRVCTTGYGSDFPALSLLLATAAQVGSKTIKKGLVTVGKTTLILMLLAGCASDQLRKQNTKLLSDSIEAEMRHVP